MRICGKRASRFTQSELAKMLLSGNGPRGEKLTPEQIKEIDKTFKIREGGNTNGGYAQE